MPDKVTMTVSVEELQNIAALSQLSPQCLGRLAGVMVRRTYAAGEFIFLESEPASGIWFIARGRVRIIKESTSGRAQGMCLASAGKCFGGCPLFDGAVNPATAQAVDDVALLLLPLQETIKLIHDDTHLSWALLNVLGQRLAHLARLSEGLGTQPVSSRLADCLLAYADERQTPPVVLLTHEELAVLVGTAREVVSRWLSRMEKQGMIQAGPGRIVLADLEALRASRQLGAACVAAQMARPGS